MPEHLHRYRGPLLPYRIFHHCSFCHLRRCSAHSHLLVHTQPTQQASRCHGPSRDSGEIYRRGANEYGRKQPSFQIHFVKAAALIQLDIVEKPRLYGIECGCCDRSFGTGATTINQSHSLWPCGMERGFTFGIPDCTLKTLALGLCRICSAT